MAQRAAAPPVAGDQPELLDIKSASDDALLPYQETGVRFVLKNDGRCLIADEMGLGKTVQALAAAAHYRDSWPFLVVCPSSVRFVWFDLALNWLPRFLKQEDICMVKTGKQVIPKEAKMVVMSYNLCANRLSANDTYKLVIYDESHYLKSWDSKRTKVLVPAAQRANHVILLSGTPARNNSHDLHP